jgi:DNA/RNA-binding domain of Phe-tRNA-synthetase-like protein
MQTFLYHPDILARYPNLFGGVILAQGLANGSTPEKLQKAFQIEQRAALDRIGETPLSEIEPLAAWRTAFRAFGVNPTRYRSAAEALLRRLTKKGDIPNLNTLVDISNLVSIRYSLPVATFDIRDLQSPVSVQFATGTERFTPLGRTEIEHPEPGEVIFSDETGLVIARRWCWRQSAESAAGLDTQAAIITVEAQHVGGQGDIEAALHDLLALLPMYAGGDFKSGILGPDRLSISRHQ